MEGRIEKTTNQSEGDRWFMLITTSFRHIHGIADRIMQDCDASEIYQNRSQIGV